MLKLTVMHSFPIIQLKRFEQLNIKQGQSSKTSGKALQVLVRSKLYASVLVELICSICKCFLNLSESLYNAPILAIIKILMIITIIIIHFS